jgi:hypothetical protein
MKKLEPPKYVDLRGMFLALQSQMISALAASREIIPHPSAKGDATELHWLAMLSSHLPERYRAEKVFVIDSQGAVSDQLDVVIYDRQYSPFIFNQGNTKFVPCESVYAVFEVKQDLSAANLRYAGAKAATVRKLRRTSVPIPHAGGKFEAKTSSPILAGILTLGSEWNPSFGKPFNDALSCSNVSEQLDLGCAVDCGGFTVRHGNGEEIQVSISSKDTALIYFFLQLLTRLQQLGTVAAMDLTAYGRAL